jgi:site-specific recombinase XerD
MKTEKLENYQKYLEIKGYQKSSIQGLVKRARKYENQETENKNLSTPTLKLYYYQKKVYLKYLQEIEGETRYLPEEHYKKVIPEIPILTEQEVRELFTKTKNLREKAVLTCLYSLGLRVGEAANIYWEDLDFTEKLVFIRKSKTRKQRQIPLNTASLTLINEYIQKERNNKGEKLLQGIQGNLTADGICQILRKIVRRTKIKKRVYPHLLRHSIASHLLQRGMDIEQVGKFLGHSSLESTQRYTHLLINKEGKPEYETRI